MASPTSTAVKICGITDITQAISIAKMGADAIGVIGVPSSPRFISSNQKRAIFSGLEKIKPRLKRVLVLANPSDLEIQSTLKGEGCPSVIQLHGDETIEECQNFRKSYPKIEWWKAIRIKSPKDLFTAKTFANEMDALLLDAWDKDQLGGTGKRLPIEWLKGMPITTKWWLAGGISAECLAQIFSEINPSGVDASSQLEISPGIKDLKKVKELIKAVKDCK